MSTDITSRWKMLFQSLRPMKTRYSYILFLLLAINSYTALIAQQLPSISIDDLLKAKSNSNTQLAEQRKIYPQEKLYVMTDAELYMPGDTIWLRVWVQDGETLKDSQIGSRYVYADLTDSRDSRLCIAKLKMRDGMFYGYLPLPSGLHSGQYTLAVHTHYQHLIPDDYICKRVINVLTQQHLRAGYTVRPLYEHQLVLTDSLTSTDITYNRIRRTDTLQHVNFQTPANTWFAISVTDDQLSPIDTSHTITHGLTSIPDFFTHDNLLKNSFLYRPLSSPETEDEAKGIVITYDLLSPEENKLIDVTVFNLKTQQIYFTHPNENKEFTIEGIDIPDGSVLCYTASFDGIPCNDIIAHHILYKDTINHIETGRSRYFVKPDKELPINSDSLTQDNINLLTPLQAMAQGSSTGNYCLPQTEIVDAPKKLSKKLERIIQQNFYTDDIYTTHASKTIRYDQYIYDREQFSAIDKAMKFKKKGVNFIREKGLYYRTPQGRKVPVRIVVGSTEWPLAYDADSILELNDALRIPVELIYALHFIKPSVAQKISPSISFPDSPILQIDLFTGPEVSKLDRIGNVLISKPVGYQKPQQFHNNQISPRMVHTRYWNPAINSGPAGQISIDLPLPPSHHTTYTLRAEGVTPDGQPVSIIRRITR